MKGRFSMITKDAKREEKNHDDVQTEGHQNQE